jgi:uncharacterized protein involved in response to NO
MTISAPATLHALGRSPRAGRRVALLELGFRPFFLLAGAFAAAAVPLWLVALRGGLRPGGPFGAMQWHAHEMLFGFTSAVIAGFALTATSNWTGRRTVRGPLLGALAAVWALGRVAIFFAAWAPRTAAVLDWAFLPLVALACAVPLLGARNRRNYVFLGLLAALSACNAASHWAALERDGASVQRAHGLALGVIVLLIVVVTGRVVPAFTRNAVGVTEIAGSPTLERAALAMVVLATVSEALATPVAVRVLFSLLAAVVLAARMGRWGSWSARRDPLLWILHLGSAWLPAGFALRAGAAITDVVPAGSAVHALTAGAIGCLTLGMMARVSLGHTGRMLRASHSAVAAFAGVALAGALRVAAPMLPSALVLPLLEVAGTIWAGAFALFFLSHWRMLVAPRVDGR